MNTGVRMGRASSHLVNFLRQMVDFHHLLQWWVPADGRCDFLGDRQIDDRAPCCRGRCSPTGGETGNAQNGYREPRGVAVAGIRRRAVRRR